jgi:hypothetical protein
VVIDPTIGTHYGTCYERSRLFPGGRRSLAYVRSMELLERLLPAPPARFSAALGDARARRAPWRREHILLAARSAETQSSLIGFSHHLIAAATKT